MKPMRITSKRIAIGTGVIAVALAGGLVFTLEVVPFEVRYDVKDLLLAMRERYPMISTTLNSFGPVRPRTPNDDEDDRESIADLIAEATGGQDCPEIRVEKDWLIAKVQLHRQVRIWSALRAVRAPLEVVKAP